MARISLRSVKHQVEAKPTTQGDEVEVDKVAYLEAALNQLFERIAEDRYLLAIELVGSLSTETIWHRETLGLWIIEADGVGRRLQANFRNMAAPLNELRGFMPPQCQQLDSRRLLCFGYHCNNSARKRKENSRHLICHIPRWPVPDLGLRHTSKWSAYAMSLMR
jgi:hypothetical protein